MKKSFRISFSLLMLIALVGLIFVGCQKTDVVVASGLKSFEALAAVPALNTQLGADGYVTLTAPNGESVSMTTTPEASDKDLLLTLDLAPFVAAGLDTTKLAEGYSATDNQLIIASEFTDKAYEKAATDAVSALNGLIGAQRDRFGYHEALDHYGIGFGNGNMFEWAKDMAKNDKDYVFVLEPTLLAEAGLNPESVEGWLYADVEVKGDDGQKQTVKKLLKPFDLP